MKVIVGNRGSGKTTELLKLAHETDAYLVVRDAGTGERLFHASKNAGIDIRNPVSFSDLLGSGLRGCRVPIIVDDVDELIRVVARGIEVKAIAVGFDDNLEILTRKP